MKKILIILLTFSVLFLQNVSLTKSSNCSYDGNGEIGSALNNCIGGTKLAGKETGNLKVDGSGFKDKINSWKNTLAIFLGIAAVFGLVFAGFMFTISAGEEEKINKAKEIAKWSILGFLAIVFAATIITFLVSLFYSI